MTHQTPPVHPLKSSARRASLLLASIASCLGLCSVVSKAAVFNIAEGKPVSASAYAVFEPGQTTYLPEKAVDGDLASGWSSGLWANLVEPQWLKVDLLSAYSLDRVVAHGAVSDVASPVHGFTMDYRLSVSLDGSNWALVKQGTLVDDPNPELNTVDVPLGEAEVRYIMFEGIGGSHHAHLWELQAFAVTPVPEPADYAVVLGLLAGIVGIRRRLNSRCHA